MDKNKQLSDILSEFYNSLQTRYLQACERANDPKDNEDFIRADEERQTVFEIMFETFGILLEANIKENEAEAKTRQLAKEKLEEEIKANHAKLEELERKLNNDK